MTEHCGRFMIQQRVFIIQYSTQTRSRSDKHVADTKLTAFVKYRRVYTVCVGILYYEHPLLYHEPFSNHLLLI